jgi:4-amino-4-deoxy-L-arabinose transferase-like glycosyltransferase
MAASASNRVYERVVLVTIAALLAIKFFFAAILPLSGDEALYWKYTLHIAPGYIDHPPINVLMIRLGTEIFGTTPLGVRCIAVLTIMPSSWAIWRSAQLLFREPDIGPTAGLLFNLTVVGSLGSMIATSDVYVVLFSALLLFAVAKLNPNGRPIWWLAIGVVFGLGMLSKYTMVFSTPALAVWVLTSPERRKWLLTPWPWCAGVLAVILFSPVLVWNAQHQWASFGYQAHRMVIQHLSLKYPVEYLGSQVALATPSVFGLGCLGLFGRLGITDDQKTGRLLLMALIAPISLYFLWHALHQRVQGNWPEPIYPAFAVAGALAVVKLRDQAGRMSGLADGLFKSAIPIGLALPLLVLSQAAFHWMPLKKDPTSRELAVGFGDAAVVIDQTRQRLNSPVVMTSDYTLNAWLSFYLPSRPRVVQLNERIRWINEPEPDPRLFNGNILYVCRDGCPYLDFLRSHYKVVEPVQNVERKQGSKTISIYGLYRLSGPTGSVFDPVYPPMNHGGRNY